MVEGSGELYHSRGGAVTAGLGREGEGNAPPAALIHQQNFFEKEATMQQRLALALSLTALALLTAVLSAEIPPAQAPAAGQPAAAAPASPPPASTSATPPKSVAETLDELRETVAKLDPSRFTGGRKKLFASRLATAIHRLERGHDLAAASQIRSLQRTTDGCVAAGRPDRNDWVLDCEAQEALHRRLLEARRGLEEGR